MKVFALMCAAAIAVSTPMVDAAADVAVSCTDLECTQLSLSIPTGQKAVYTPPACDPTTEKAYLKMIAITGVTDDLLTFVTKSAGTPLTGACVDSTAGESVSGGTEQVPLTCGSGLGTAITVEVSCTRSVGPCVPSANAVTFACAATTETEDPTLLKCTNNVCSSTGGKITSGTPVSVAIGTACTAPKKAFVKAISYAGVTSTDKLTYAVKSGTTAVNGITCSTAEASATVGLQTLAEVTPLTCGKGGVDDATAELTCKKASGDCTADYSVTFDCAEPTAAPTPSMGSMLTKANVIVGLISGMVGAVVYFNRG